MEHNGDLYVCDHFVFPEFKLGNLNDTPLKDLTSQQSLRTFGQNKKRLLTRQCQECEVVMANVPKTASQRRPMERGDIITSVRDITSSSPMLPPIWTL